MSLLNHFDMLEKFGKLRQEIMQGKDTDDQTIEEVVMPEQLFHSNIQSNKYDQDTEKLSPSSPQKSIANKAMLQNCAGPNTAFD